MAGTRQDGDRAGASARRRPREEAPRTCTVRFDLTEKEITELAAAAGRAGLAKGAYAAEAAMAAARGGVTVPGEPLREALSELVTASGLLRKIGTLMNQAVARLNATGQRSGDLVPVAMACLRRADRVDEAAEQVRRAVR